MTSEIFEVGLDGIGSEIHPNISPLYPQDEGKREFYDNIIKEIYAVHGYKPDEEIIVKKKDENLYLNKKKIILLSKVDPRKRIRILFSRINRWWHQESTQDLRDLFNFIIIHGILASLAGMSFLMLIGVEHWMINYIRGNIWLTAIIFIIGSGSLYYLLLDVNKELFESWGKIKVRRK